MSQQFKSEVGSPEEVSISITLESWGEGQETDLNPVTPSHSNRIMLIYQRGWGKAGKKKGQVFSLQVFYEG